MLLINLKTYREGSGERAVALARIAERVAREEGVEIAVAAQAPDIFRISSSVGIKVFSQHVDGVDFGKNTGAILAETVKEAGVVGIILNHSERRISLDILKQTIEKCKKTGLKTVVCTESLEEAGKIAEWGPDYISFEDPGLIGSGKSITRFRGEEIREFADFLKGKGIVPLCGAGISTGEDVRAARELGVEGMIVASAIVKSPQPELVIREMARALKG